MKTKAVKPAKQHARPVDQHQHNARELLIETAKKLFATKGLDGTTVREIAVAAAVNPSLVSYHFKGKEGLYMACLQELNRKRFSSVQSILHPPATMQEFRIRLEIFIEEIVGSIIEEPEINSIFHREFENKSVRGIEMLMEAFKSLRTSLTDFIESAKKHKLVRSDVEPRVCVFLFFGLIAHISRTCMFMPDFFAFSPSKESKSKTKIGQQLTTLFIEGIVAKEGKNG